MTVFQCQQGDIVMWYHVSQSNAVKAWLSIALAEIARLSAIDIITNCPAADDMFQYSVKVWAMLEKLNNGISLTTQQDKFMEFNPPMKAKLSDSKRTKASKKNSKSVPKMRLCFDVAEQDTVSVLSSDEVITKSKGPRKNLKAKDLPIAAAKDTKELAEKASIKLCEVAKILLEKFPPMVKNPFGDFFTIPDEFGFPRPVVYPLTEENLLRS